jgi:hypothetical protein
MPDRRRNVYARPWSVASGSVTARSGTSREPSDPATWLRLTSPSLANPRSDGGEMFGASLAAGSIVSTAWLPGRVVSVQPW